MLPSYIKLIPILSLLLCGCATMNRDECLNADWKIIGLEDGTKGRALAYIGKHREACAEYSISPDLENYQRGHTQGLEQYCTYFNGFRIGLRGNSCNNVCPQNLVQDFRFGHQRGREIYSLNKTIKKTQASIDEIYTVLEELDQEVLLREDIIINAKTSKADRVLLLDEIKELQARISYLEVDIEEFEELKTFLISKRNLLKQEYQAGPN